VDPIGQCIRYPTAVEGGRWTGWTPWITIVGVVADVRSIAPAEAPEPAIYVSYAQRPRAAYSGTTLTVVARSAAPVAIRDRARALDGRAIVAPARELADVVGSVLARPRFMSQLLSGFAVVAVTIALFGVYALVAYGVASRAREIGVRVALGASRTRVLGLATRQLIATLGIGLPTGLVSAWFLARWMTTLLYGVGAWEPATYAGVALGFGAAAVAATLGPLRRALRVDPVVALRAE
jgi:hypothetical protein